MFSIIMCREKHITREAMNAGMLVLLSCFHAKSCVMTSAALCRAGCGGNAFMFRPGCRVVQFFSPPPHPDVYNEEDELQVGVGVFVMKL